MKKTKKILLAVLAALTIGTITAGFASCNLLDSFFGETNEEIIEYTLNSDGESYTLTSVSGVTNLIIPDTYEGKPVTKIDSTLSNLKSITIGKNISSISEKALKYSRQLENLSVAEGNEYYTSIDGSLYNYEKTKLLRYAFWKKDTSFTVPASVTHIVKGSFYNSKNLTDIELPNEISYIEDETFSDCPNINFHELNDVLYLGNKNSPYLYLIKTESKELTSYEIPAQTRIIHANAFSYCTQLANLTASENLTYIGTRAFEKCAFSNISIPASVQFIGESAFALCENLTITVDKNNEYYKMEDGVLFTKDGSTLLQYTFTKSNSYYEIPNGVTHIGEQAFSFINNLLCIKLPESLTSMGANSFYLCQNLYKVINHSNLDITFDFRNCGFVTQKAAVLVDKLGNKTYSSSDYIEIDNFLFKLTSYNDYSMLAYLGTETTISSLPKSVNGVPYHLKLVKGIQHLIMETDFNFTSKFFSSFDSPHLISVQLGKAVTTIPDALFGVCENLKIYYEGTETAFKKIKIGPNLALHPTATIYYYSKNKPILDGNYWHYDENGNPIVW